MNLGRRFASTIRAFELVIVPGLVQIAEYTRHVFVSLAKFHQTPRDTDEAVRIRLERQRALYDSAKRIELLMCESAVRYFVCPPDVMVAQIDRLLALLSLPTVRLGIIPLDTRLPTVPINGFLWPPTMAASHSAGNPEQCVEVGSCRTSTMVRDSKNLAGPVLAFTHGSWSAFIETAKSGALDLDQWTTRRAPPGEHAFAGGALAVYGQSRKLTWWLWMLKFFVKTVRSAPTLTGSCCSRAGSRDHDAPFHARGCSHGRGRG
ncbi:DUF397 domain-containing protein [Streptoalloteichus tenebrarius]|nr:hypothetical protein GCM10020241_34360 [Streptoalloteichus tenebrarius]